MARVLFVDDDKSLRNAYLDFARENSIEAVGACNGIDALLKLKEGGIALVVSDVRMPRMGGIDLLARIKVQYPLISVIIVSGNADDEYKSQEHGAVAYFVKPFSYQTLFEKISALMDQYELQKKRSITVLEKK